MNYLPPALLYLLAFCLPTFAQQNELATVSGLVIPRDNDGMYVRNREGQFEVQWTNKTKVALKVNTRQFAGLKNNKLRFKVHSSKQTIDFALPKGPVTGVVPVRSGRFLEAALKLAKDENWIPERELRLHFGTPPLAEQLPSETNLRFVGIWDSTAKPRTLNINDKKFEISLKKGGQTTALLFGVLSTRDCQPFVNRATVVGHRAGDVVIADEIHIMPIGDQAANDNPKLPRYLFIGDSISGNYSAGLRASLEGKYNLHHPPTNCGPAGNGKTNIVQWLGAYKEKGRHWDVISFNFGHWDAGNDKASYQASLEAVVKELKKTGAKLVWVTTCPVPAGMPAAGELAANGKAPGRKSQVMNKYLNPWAAEVIARHPEISTCDQWQFVKDHERDIYKDWWPGTNVHFSGDQADALGNLLAKHVEKIMK